jgi:hypothetical protein
VIEVACTLNSVGIAGDEIEGGGKLPHSEAPCGRGIPSNDPLSPVVVTICQTQFQSKDSSHPPECDNIPHKPPHYLIELVKPGIQPVSTGLQLFPNSSAPAETPRAGNHNGSSPSRRCGPPAPYPQIAAYQGDDQTRADLFGKLQTGIAGGSLDADSLLSGYCRLLYDRFGTYEEVARRAGLDRRTLKAYIRKETAKT